MYFGCGACLKVENKDPEHFSNIAIPPSRSTMSESPEAPEGLPENFETKVILNLLFIQTRRSSKGKVKESKSQKNKRACFHIFGQQLCRISSNAPGQALTGRALHRSPS